MPVLRLILCFLVWLGFVFPASAAALGINNFHVLCYHNILDDPLKDPEPYTVSTAELVQHFSWLKEQGYKVISVDDLVEAKAGRPLPPKAVMLTFDDGYRSFYTHVFPLLRAFNYSATLALEGSWLQLKQGEKAPYDDHSYTRASFLEIDEIREMVSSGLVEVASHSYNLHHGILANPQGNLLPAAVTRAYDTRHNTYESDAEYLSRIRYDLAKNNEVIRQITGKYPRIMVWPYGKYNLDTVSIANSLGMPITFTLDDGVNSIRDPLWQVKRMLVGFNTTIANLRDELAIPVPPSPQRVMHVDVDYIYDPNPIRQEENLSRLLDRVKAMKVSTVYLQAYADPDGNGAADGMYFPNRHLPMRADLFNRVAWQLKTRTSVEVFAWMPLLAYELPPDHRLASHRVTPDSSDKSTGGYPRLSPFDPEVRQLIAEIYEDLAKHSIFDGILFHDDATLSDYEDASPWALEYYSKQWELPESIAEIRKEQSLLRKWTSHKTRFLTEFSLDLAKVVRRFQPRLKTARNIYAEVVLNPDSEEWFAQSLPDFLKSYDYTAVMAMPFMENADKPMAWLRKLVREVAKQPQALPRTVFELQSVDWRNSKPVDSHLLASQMKLLRLEGVRNFGYYPDDFLNDSPSFEVIKPVFSLQEFPFSGK